MTCIAAVKAADARLRWQGLRCLGSMVGNEEKWTRQVQQQHGDQLLSLLSEKSAEDPAVRCRRQALLALASFLSGLAPEDGEEPSPETLAFVRQHRLCCVLRAWLLQLCWHRLLFFPSVDRDDVEGTGPVLLPVQLPLWN